MSDRARLTWLVAKRDYQRTVRRRGFLFGSLLLPLGIAALMAISAFLSMGDPAAGGGGTIVLVNQSSVPIADGAYGTVAVTTLSPDEARAQLDDDRIASYYVVPADLRDGGTVTHVQGESAPGLDQLEAQENDDGLVAYVLREALLREAGVPSEVAAWIMSGVTIVTVDTSGDEISTLDMAARVVVPILFAALFMMSIFITSGYLLQSVTEEKENRVVEIVLSSIPAGPLMAGKVLGLGAAGLTQVLIWVGTALIALPILASQVPDLGSIGLDPTVLVLAVLYFVLGYFAYGAIFAAIGAVAPGNREAQQYSGFLGFFAAIPFLLLSAGIGDPTSLASLVVAIFPLTAPIAMLLILGLAPTIPWTLVGASLVSLTLFGILATWACARIFRATVLLYGVRPTARMLLDAVRSPH